MDDDQRDDMSQYGSVRSGHSASRAGSVASLGSGLAQQAKTLVNSMNNFNCTVLNDRTPGRAAGGGLGGLETPSQFADHDIPYEGRGTSSRKKTPTVGTMHRGRSMSASRKQASRTFRQYSRSPQRVDV